MPYDLTLIDSRGGEILMQFPHVRLREIDGLGMPEVRHLEEQYAQQDGVTYLGSRVGKRIVPMGFQLVEDTEAALWDAREEMIRLVKVLSAGFRARMSLPNGNVRQLDLRYDSGFTMPRAWDMGNKRQVAALIAVAHNPCWYDPTSVLWAFDVSGGEGSWGWEPAGLGWDAGWGASAALGTPEAKVYPGDWLAYPRVTLYGPMVEPVVTNHTIDAKLEFVAGYAIDEGESVVIELTMDSAGKRPLTVTHSVDGNIPDALTDDSDLGSWHIAAHPEAVDGINMISVAFSGGNPQSRAELRFNPRYIGI